LRDPAAIPHRFTLRVEASGALLYDRAAHQYFQLDAAEAFLLSASQEVSLKKAVKQLAEAVGHDEAASARDALLERGELGDDGAFPGLVLRMPDIRGAYGAPLVAHLGLTLACNYACAHCYSSSGKRADNELSLEDIQGLIDRLAEAGCMKLVLGGGEPFLRDDLAAVIRYADGKGVDCFVHTNGSVLTQQRLEALAACPPAGLAVSMDGPDAETNDEIRGAHAFERTLKGLQALQQHYPPGFNISVTITPKNVRFAPRMVELAHQAGAKVLLLRPAYPAGEAARAAALMCSRDDFARAIDLARVRAKQLGVKVDAPHPHEQGVPDFDGFGCVAARIVMGIDPQGKVTPCLNLPSSFSAGDARTDSIEKLWRAGKGFVAVRGQTPNSQCQSCKHYETCRGGCRVRSLFAGNGLNGPDSWCHYEPKEDVKPKRSRRTAARKESRT
jgi:radical SAM protein with 4Fe4S-binding SPASM domain